jgi:hypothetical protein
MWGRGRKAFSEEREEEGVVRRSEEEGKVRSLGVRWQNEGEGTVSWKKGWPGNQRTLKSR